MSKFSTFQSLCGVGTISMIFTGLLLNNVKDVAPAVAVTSRVLTHAGLAAGVAWGVGKAGMSLHSKLAPLMARGAGVSV
jgi:hypothetical protein